ncbi:MULTISPECIES: hypothetical protein [Chryseobacterium]|uniref:hypothetical protein n=1 Tax=Chryseobacterium TaxID=59732 RepID=UPI000EBBD595|nr:MULTISPECIES: hypothetical protein [Chryseobacterium]HCM35452.1 hypothetical protein [Chryseobacterium sp.]
MISRVFIIVFSLFFTFSFSQKKKKAKDLLAEIHRNQHGEVNTDFKSIPLQKRMSRFPFDKAAKVKIISYNLNYKGAKGYTPPPPPPVTKQDSINLNTYYENLKKYKSVEIEDLIKESSPKGIQESKTLTFTEISELSDVLFNTCHKYYVSYTSQSGCFFPRNAILFYDEHDKVFAYFEICFECSGIESSPKDMMDSFETCEFLYPDLEKFFKNKGLTTKYVP